MSSKNKKIKIGIAIGDPSGIGLEAILKVIQKKELVDFFTPIIFGSVKQLNAKRVELEMENINPQGIFKARDAIADKINVVNLWKEVSPVIKGQSTPESIQMARESLLAGVDALSEKYIDILVTAPANYPDLKTADFPYTSLTEYLSKQYKERAYNLFTSEKINIMSMREEAVSNADLLEQCIIGLKRTLRVDFSISKPKIAIVSPNSIQAVEGDINSYRNRTGDLVFGYGEINQLTDFNYGDFDTVIAMNYPDIVADFNSISQDEGAILRAGVYNVITSPSQKMEYKEEEDVYEGYLEQAIFKAIDIFRNRIENFRLIKGALRKRKVEASDFSEDE